MFFDKKRFAENFRQKKMVNEKIAFSTVFARVNTHLT